MSDAHLPDKLPDHMSRKQAERGRVPRDHAIRGARVGVALHLGGSLGRSRRGCARGRSDRLRLGSRTGRLHAHLRTRAHPRGPAAATHQLGFFQHRWQARMAACGSVRHSAASA